MTRWIAALLGAASWAAPLLLAIVFAFSIAMAPDAWRGFFAHPQVPGATLLALWTGTAAASLALLVALLVVMAVHGNAAWVWVPFLAGAALAIPHLAFAIGFNFLVMPSGIMARLAVGGDVPPDWVSTQDPWGLSLVAVLALKESPFLMLMLWAAMSQGDAAPVFAGQVRAARSLGHGMRSVWLRVLLPQLLRRSVWPLVIVWVYGVTVVDLALVAGPTQPPTLAVVIWTALNDAAAEVNRMGVAGAVAMTMLLAAIAAAAAGIVRLLSKPLSAFYARGPDPAAMSRWPGLALMAAGAAIYGGVMLALGLLSVSPLWPYPALAPEAPGLAAWQGLRATALMTSLVLAIATAMTATGLAVLWFECQAARRDRPILALALLALGLPAIAIAAGQYWMFLRLGLSGTGLGLFLVHLTPVLAYVFIVLREPYRAFDRRLAAVSRSLGASPLRSWWTVKLPLLRAPVLTALAVGFSVSMVQFVPAQLVAAGRFSTLPIETVTLAAGGNRALTAAHALALTLPAMLVFAMAGIFGRPRWR